MTLRGVGFPKLDATASGSGITLKADGTILQGFRIRNSGNFPIGQEGAAIKVESNNNTITGNEVLNNFNGILVSRAWNRIFNNIVRGNLGYGIKLLNANNSTIYGNIFMENYGVNAYDNGLNKWDNNTRGNFYSDYDSSDEGCLDENKDALCDLEHDIPGGQGVDRYPLARIIES
ncbi:MAG: right-handed parallel beta-helix repeat-containing protein [Methanotrichaceae archaeon]|nr:right-handed parallel beta-helix repeat-containing protein [Methanotrichaceae archaeon]